MTAIYIMLDMSASGVIGQQRFFVLISLFVDFIHFNFVSLAFQCQFATTSTSFIFIWGYYILVPPK